MCHTRSSNIYIKKESLYYYLPLIPSLPVPTPAPDNTQTFPNTHNNMYTYNNTQTFPNTHSNMYTYNNTQTFPNTHSNMYILTTLKHFQTHTLKSIN